MPKPAITRINGGFQVAANTTNKNNGFYAPQLTTVQRNAIPPATLANGAIIYNTTLGIYQFYQVINAVSTWSNLSVTTSAATGIGLTTGTAFTLPSGPNANVQVPANEIHGFMYYDVTTDTTKIWQGGAWGVVTVV